MILTVRCILYSSRQHVSNYERDGEQLRARKLTLDNHNFAPLYHLLLR